MLLQHSAMGYVAGYVTTRVPQETPFPHKSREVPDDLIQSSEKTLETAQEIINILPCVCFAITTDTPLWVLHVV
jgi:hypothetical protein